MHEWPIWVIVGWDFLDTPTGRVPRGFLLGNDRPRRHILPFLNRKIMDIFFELERTLTDGTVHTTSWRQPGVHDVASLGNCWVELSGHPYLKGSGELPAQE